MTKTIVILLDGTSNEVARNRTHILRLYGCLKKDEEQLVYYDPGVGTFGPNTPGLRPGARGMRSGGWPRAGAWTRTSRKLTGF